jgi:hypothetical protein
MTETEKNKDFDSIDEEARAFSQLFRDPEKPYELKSHLTPDQLFDKAGFREVKFEDLDPKLQEGIKNRKSQSWYGYPLYSSSSKQNERSHIFANSNGDTVYCVLDTGDNDYSWSRLRKVANGYKISTLNHDSNLSDMISIISFFEIKNRQNPTLYPNYEGSDIFIPTVADAQITEDVRGQVGGL